MSKNKPIYLDYASATPVDDDVLTAMQPFYSEKFYNPSAIYSGALEVKSYLDIARSSVAKNIGSKPSEITFTAGGTESINLAINGIMKLYSGSEIIISSVEHDAVRNTAINFPHKLIPVDKTGRIIAEKLEKLITDKTVLISCIYANNEVGTIQPIKEITTLVQKIRFNRDKKNVKLPLYVHTDASQAPLYLDINVARLGIDLMTLNGGKIYGPKQSGILYHKIGVKIQPQILGGGQEMGIRSGTENVAQSVGFAKALEISITNRNVSINKINNLKKYFIDNLVNNFKIAINGSKKHDLPSIIHVTFEGVDNERMLFSLDEQGFYVATGSACSASDEDVSKTLTAMGISEKNARSSIRFSIGKHTTTSELDKTIKAISTAIKA